MSLSKEEAGKLEELREAKSCKEKQLGELLRRLADVAPFVAEEDVTAVGLLMTEIEEVGDKIDDFRQD